jgi:hypothetical protein
MAYNMMKGRKMKNLTLFLSVSLLLVTSSVSAEMSTDQHIDSLMQEYALKYKVKTEQLGSYKSCFKKCMIKHCSYCAGKGSCHHCDRTKKCKHCDGTCELNPAGDDICATGCGVYALRCIF